MPQTHDDAAPCMTALRLITELKAELADLRALQSNRMDDRASLMLYLDDQVAHQQSRLKALEDRLVITERGAAVINFLYQHPTVRLLRRMRRLWKRDRS